MCGGAGTRLWPASRENRPKQFLPLFGALSTFQDTMRRVADPALFARPIAVTNGQYRFLIAEQLAAIGVETDILLEPARRDSGPAIAAGAGYALQRDDGALIVALAADHVVTDPSAFAKVCKLASAAAEEDRIVMFGVEPTRPAAEYGYIRTAHCIGPACSPSKGSSRSPTPRLPRVIWPSVTCGTRAISRSAPVSCSRSIAASSRKALPRWRPRSLPPALISASSRSVPTPSPAQQRNQSTMR
jgi:hypothetical protein